MHKRLPQQGEVNPKKAQSGSSQSTTRRLSPDSRNYGFAVAGARTLGFLLSGILGRPETGKQWILSLFSTIAQDLIDPVWQFVARGLNDFGKTIQLCITKFFFVSEGKFSSVSTFKHVRVFSTWFNSRPA